MRLWQSWWQTLMLSSQYNPPRFIELVMLNLAMAVLLIWGITGAWPYLVLSLSYGVGAASSILVREAIAPSPHPHAAQVSAVVLLIISCCGFADLVHLW